jgi:fibronectin-binding autotransporter adhesin
MNVLPRLVITTLLVLAFFSRQGMAQDLYFDTNGSTGGTSTNGTGNDSEQVWTTDSTGSSATEAIVQDSDLVFSASDGVNVGTGTQGYTFSDGDTVDSFTFDNGTVALDGDNGAGITLGDGLSIASTIKGPTTFDSSLGMITLTSQIWVNNSVKALNVNSGLTASSASTLTYNGAGSGALNLNGVVSGSLSLTADGSLGTGSGLINLNNGSNTFTGTVTAENGGSVFVAHAGALNNNGVVLSNGGILSLDDNQGYNQWNTDITLENGGGTLEGEGQDIVFAGAITGDVLNVGNIDLLTQGGSNSDIGTINVVSNRMMIGSYAILGGSSGTTVVNVDSGAVLGFGWGGFGATFGNQINLLSGGAIENRQGGSVLNDVIFPGTGIVTIGADDSGGGSLQFQDSTINLNGDLEIDIHGRSGSPNATQVYLDNPITGSGNLTFGPASDGTSSYLEIGNNGNANNYSGTTTIDDLTVYLNGSNPFGSSTVTLNNATIRLPSGYDNGLVNEQFVLGTGTNLFDGNYAGGIADFSGSVVNGAGDTLHLTGSNNTIDGNTASDYSILDLDSGRTFLLGANPLNFIANGTEVNVASGAYLDFSSYNAIDATNTINFASGSGFTVRGYNGNPTNVTLENAMLPTSGSFVVGADDVGGGNITLTHGVTLTGDLTIENSYQGGGGTTTVTMNGAIDGSGGLIVTSGYDGDPGILILGGANGYSGATTIKDGTVQIASTSSLPTTTAVEEGGSGTSGTLILGDAHGSVNATVAGLTSFEGSTGNSIYNGNTGSSAPSSLNVNLASGTDTYNGTIGNNNSANGNNLSLTKSGAGTLALTGTSTYTGGTTVAGGKLAVNGSIAGDVSVAYGAEVGGSGSIGGTISGAGAVGPGNSPGILTASAVNAAAGTSFNFEFTLAGTSPDYGDSSASGNDVLHLEGASPFTAALTAGNVINLYFSGAGTYTGGFFVDGSANLATAIDSATFNYYIEDASGSVSYNGNNYELTSGSETTIAAVNAGFADGSVSGTTEEFTAGAAPEPSTYAMLLGGLAFLGFVIRRRQVQA